MSLTPQQAQANSKKRAEHRLNMTMNRTTPTRLECGDTVWYTPRPRTGDIVWCSQCREYAGVERTIRGSVYEDGYTRTTVGTSSIGECWDCEYTTTRSSVKALEQAMFKHLAIIHGESTLMKYSDATLVKMEDTGDDPPF